MRDLWKRKYVVWLSIGTFAYGIAMYLLDTYIRILEPPGLYLLLSLTLLLPILTIMSIVLKKPEVEGWLVVGSAVLWSFISWFYLAHPVVNGGWILCAIIAGCHFIVLSRGDFH